jgi:Rrf2 family transcriptional regulator, cysteine metabolism repressor
MRVSSGCHYATRALIDIATHQDDCNVVLSDIAERQSISSRHLARAIAPLVREGIIRSYKGINGGFTLGRDPVEIKLSEIYRICEGSFSLVAHDASPAQHRRTYAETDLWDELQEQVFRVLDSRSIQDLLEADESLKASIKDLELTLVP